MDDSTNRATYRHRVRSKQVRLFWSCLVGVWILLFFTRPSSGAATQPIHLSILNKSLYSTRSVSHPAGNQLFFTRYDSQYGSELWRSDGTAAGTRLVKDIYPGNASSDPYLIAAVDSIIFFVATDGIHGRELWKSDGTKAGTKLVKDLVPGSGDSDPWPPAIINGNLIFTAKTPTSWQLWTSDGSEQGTRVVPNTAPVLSPFGPVWFYTTPAFAYFVTNEGLWRTDSTEQGSLQLSTANLFLPATAGNQFYAISEDRQNGEAVMAHLWVSDGTPTNTHIIRDFPVLSKITTVSQYADIDGMLYFTNYKNPYSTMELWHTDGTTTGTLKRATACGDIGAPYAEQLTQVNGLLFFLCGAVQPGSMNTGYELWRSDGTQSGTFPLKRFYHADNRTGLLSLTNINGSLVFSVDDGVHGREIWKSDGSVVGTVLLADVNSGLASSNAYDFQQVGSSMCFTADDGIHGLSLWSLPIDAVGPAVPKPVPPTQTPTQEPTSTFTVFAPLISNH